jgi:hypothetical protein
MEEPEEEQTPPARAHAAVMPRKKTQAQLEATMEIAPFAPEVSEQVEETVFERAQAAPDEYAYPGMRFDSKAPEEMDGTQRYGAVTQEGPGAAEVQRRRAEIEAWQLQMQEEARARAEAERAQREAQQAEQTRLARQAYEEEQARLAQQEYERQMAEYERQKAQYERDLAEYERKKAEYEAELARQTAQQSEPAPTARRRRGAQKRYSDYIDGERVQELPDAPQWPQLEQQTIRMEKPVKHHKLLDQVAKMIEQEDEQLSSLHKLPPSVNMQDAYRPAAAPRKPGRREQKD